MCLIVALLFPFRIEVHVCWLLYCVVFSLCKITQLEKQDNRKCIFATDGILEQNSVPSHFKMCCYGNMLDHGCTSLVFLRSAMVVYPCDKHKVSRLLTGKTGQLKKEVSSVALMTNFGFGPIVNLAENTCDHKTIMINVPIIQCHRCLLLIQLHWSGTHSNLIIHIGHVWPRNCLNNCSKVIVEKIS